jgi:hypothetical protein
LENPAASIFRTDEMALNPEDGGSRFALKSGVLSIKLHGITS